MTVKTFFSYEQLSEFVDQNAENGSAFTVLPQGEMYIVIGKKLGKLTVQKGDRIGCNENAGEVWLVPRADSYVDPIRTLFAQRGLSQRLLHYVSYAIYTPKDHERFIAGDFTEIANEDGTSTVHGAEIVVILQRGGDDPPFVHSVVARPRLNIKYSAKLVPWIHEAMLSPTYMLTHRRHVRGAYDIARSICLKSGIKWDHPTAYQCGSLSYESDKVTYSIHAIRDMYQPLGEHMGWIPQVRMRQDGVSHEACLSDLYASGLLRRWACHLGAIDICNACGNALSLAGKLLICPVCDDKKDKS